MNTAALAGFLRESVGSTGEVHGWVGGAPYPEIGGYLLRWLLLEGERDSAERVAGWLARSLSPRGAIGRDGHDYLFDSAIVLDALHSADREPDARRRLGRFVRDAIVEGRAVVSDDPPPRRWSNLFGPHLLKVATALRGDLSELRARLPRPTATEERYSHAHAYALEGLFLLARDDDAEAAARLPEAARALVERQTAEGGIRGWPGGPVRSDATAQAVRLWVAVDAGGLAAPIERALDHLATLQHAGGGLRYGEDSEDLNVWCTLFAHQASSWARTGRPATRLI